MDTKRLYEILAETTAQFRKGAPVETNGTAPSVYSMPHHEDAPAGPEIVDMEFLHIGVDKAKAFLLRAELIGILNTYPQPARLAEGPSYIEVGAMIGDQGAAFQLFALGKVLRLWDVITPGRLGITGKDAAAMAGAGFVMITGYRPGESPIEESAP